MSLKIVGSFPSLKNNQLVKYESTLERDLFYFLEYKSSVLHYEMRTIVITGTDAGGEFCTYTPNVLVEHTTGRTLIDCRYADLVNKKQAQCQITLGKVWAEQNNYDFITITDADLRNGYRLTNLKHLWRYSRLSVPYAVVERCLRVLRSQPNGITWKLLLAHLEGIAPQLTLAPSLAHLLFRHVLAADLNQLLSSASTITLAQQTEGT